MEEERCCLCLESQENKIRIILVCGHSMDYNCFLNLRRPLCPLCRREIETPTQFIPPTFIHIPQEQEELPTPPPAPHPSIQRQNANDFILDISDLLQPHQQPFPSQWFHENRFVLQEIPRVSNRQQRHRQRRHRQRETRRLQRRFIEELE